MALGRVASSVFAILEATARAGAREIRLVDAQEQIAHPAEEFAVRALLTPPPGGGYRRWMPSRQFGRCTTATGHRACAITPWPVDPRTIPVNPPRPRLPTTISPGSRAVDPDRTRAPTE